MPISWEAVSGGYPPRSFWVPFKMRIFLYTFSTPEIFFLFFWWGVYMGRKRESRYLEERRKKGSWIEQSAPFSKAHGGGDQLRRSFRFLGTGCTCWTSSFSHSLWPPSYWPLPFAQNAMACWPPLTIFRFALFSFYYFSFYWVRRRKGGRGIFCCV